MARTGIVTRVQRGLYALHCDTSASTSTDAPSPKVARPISPIVTPRRYTDAEIDRAVAGAWAHFEAMNDHRNPEAWA